MAERRGRTPRRVRRRRLLMGAQVRRLQAEWIRAAAALRESREASRALRAAAERARVVRRRDEAAQTLQDELLLRGDAGAEATPPASPPRPAPERDAAGSGVEL